MTFTAPAAKTCRLGVRPEAGTHVDNRPSIMIVGVGDLAHHVINQLLAQDATSRLILAGRNLEALTRRANLARFAAANLGRLCEIDVAELDLWDVPQTAESLAKSKPDIIFMSASLQSWRRLTELPKPAFEALDEAQFGPWLPMHLTLNHNLMQAVKESGTSALVVNAAFPDAVNPILDKVGLAPWIGVGNVSNIIPALTFGVSKMTQVPSDQVRVRLVAQHYFSHFVPRAGNKGNGDYAMEAVDCHTGEKLEFDHLELFAQLNGSLRRTGGVEGQLLTASSATRILRAMCWDEWVAAHAPGPDGLPGGYPVLIKGDQLQLDLPSGMIQEQAIEINEACQRADGIERIGDDGSVWYTAREMDIMRRLLGYECKHMSLSDSAEAAKELAKAYAYFSQHADSFQAEDAA